MAPYLPNGIILLRITFIVVMPWRVVISKITNFPYICEGNDPCEMKEIKIKRWKSPCGELVIGSFDGRLCMCDWGRESVIRRLTRYLDAPVVEGDTCVIEETICRLEEYFAGKRQDFDLPLLLAGTDFQRDVWNAITSIPYGDTISYHALACMSGNTAAVRAVANAVGANALSVIIPCHRVVGANGSMTGYAGGIDAKIKLLGIERDYRLSF